MAGAGQLQKEAGLSVIQTSGITMSAERHVNKIPTIRGTDIMRDPRLNKVMKVYTGCDPGHDTVHGFAIASLRSGRLHGTATGCAIE